MLDASAVAWVLPLDQASLRAADWGGQVGLARGVPVAVAQPLEGARWLVLLQPNGDLYPARLALEIDWAPHD
ncbi:MAG: hypothetical protein RLY30_105 [Pseudomonadota bacterium]|jgi:hypothetical protein